MIDIVELQKKCIEEYATGKTCREIEEQFNINYNVVSFLLKAADIKIRVNKPTVTKPKIKLPLEKIKRLYLEEDYDVLDLEVEFDVSTTTIVNRLKEMGVKLKRKIPITNQLSPEIINKLYWEDKMTSKEIGKKYGISGQNIIQYMRKHNIPRRDPHYKGKIYKKFV